MQNRKLICGCLLILVLGLTSSPSYSQERISLAYSSSDAINAIWTVAKDLGFYKKHGLDADLVYIGSTTISVAAIMAGGHSIGKAAGGGGGLTGGRGGGA